MQWSILVTIVQASLFITGAFAAFGLTESGNTYTVDTDGGLVFKSTSLHNQYLPFIESNESLTVDKTTGDVTSMVFNGIEVGLARFFYAPKRLNQVFQAQDQSGKRSQIGSGIGASCSWVRTGNSNNYIKISCSASGITQCVLKSLQEYCSLNSLSQAFM